MKRTDAAFVERGRTAELQLYIGEDALSSKQRVVATGIDFATERDGSIKRFVTHRIPVDAVAGPDAIAGHIGDCLASKARCLVTFVNPASAVAAASDARYRRALFQFDFVLPDGVGMCAAVWLVHRTKAARVSFDSTSLAPIVLAMAHERRHSVALVGGAPGQSTMAGQQIAKVYPNLEICGTFDGYGSPGERVAQLRALNPDIVICGMGIGAQEAFMLSLVDAGWSGCGFTCGGYFDQLDGGFRYYPAWVDKQNLRWAYRLYREPRRLWRRYLLQYPFFCVRTGAAALTTLASALLR